MNFDKGKKGKSNLERITVIIPVVISVLSLVFGVYQYFDKRDLQNVNMKLDQEIKDLDQEIKELERREKLMKNQAEIDIHYLEADLKGILRSDPEYSVSKGKFEKAFLAWLSHLERALPFDVKLEIRETIVCKEIMKYCNDTQDHYISFFLIRNAGGSKATEISTTFTRRKNDEREVCLIEIGQLYPRTGVIFPIDHFNKKTRKSYGTVLSPEPRYELEYIDEFLTKKIKKKIRPKLAITTILAPGVRKMLPGP